MTNTLHTPGPWTYHLYIDPDAGRPGEAFGVTAANGTKVIDGCGCCDSPWCSLPDAKLITAAPDLLAALNWLVHYFGPDVDPSLEDLLTHARTAIARATGEQV